MKMEEIKQFEREETALRNLAKERAEKHKRSSPPKKCPFNHNLRIAVPNKSEKAQIKHKEDKFEKRVFLDVNGLQELAQKPEQKE